MTQTIYTVYWENKRHGVRKQHGSYKSEEEAIEGIKAWWELQKDKYDNVNYERTNTGALEITYDDDNYVYRVEKEESDQELPSRQYKLRSEGENEANRKKYNLHDEEFLFDELAEPYRDRLILSMASSQKARDHVYDERGRLIRNLDQRPPKA
ncbi:hypothetical protein ACWOE5_01430 [Aerococcus sanguinicola]|uniref:Uncharacterized protein n=1 Tax=Aerococcus sanguinicola TaxID=119206 RepID=A0A0X8FCK6_9LACT|nr:MULTISPECIES: hypothetical protein [Aerococcus]AMB94846.1 hypothetical protein AWM72_08785 [Aerococcus sanguinicola]MDK6804208.1 hypothetical protein [Aerococcus sp. UMB7834]MDK7049621.1 hypothetical protein [Aerococcus sanguinicola]MDK8501488.1 hypothetical protein [Aerococcus sp. UMB1112A]OFT95984.1 hypothetical protein HMPREF3090_03120 [Aerococcus sp. HMSC23C02]